MALFPNTSCDLDSHFGEENIIINLTFCQNIFDSLSDTGTNLCLIGGDWAGSVYGNSGCPSTFVGESKS